MDRLAEKFSRPLRLQRFPASLQSPRNAAGAGARRGGRHGCDDKGRAWRAAASVAQGQGLQEGWAHGAGWGREGPEGMVSEVRAGTPGSIFPEGMRSVDAALACLPCRSRRGFGLALACCREHAGHGHSVLCHHQRVLRWLRASRRDDSGASRLRAGRVIRDGNSDLGSG